MKRKSETALQPAQAKVSKVENPFPQCPPLDRSVPHGSTGAQVHTLPQPSSLPAAPGLLAPPTPPISKLQQVFQQRTFCRQLSALCTQREALESRIIQLVGVKLVSYAKSEEVKITEEMAKEGLKLSAIGIDLDIPDWVASLNDVI